MRSTAKAESLEEVMGLKHSFAPSPALVLLEKAFLNIEGLKGLNPTTAQPLANLLQSP